MNYIIKPLEGFAEWRSTQPKQAYILDGILSGGVVVKGCELNFGMIDIRIDMGIIGDILLETGTYLISPTSISLTLGMWWDPLITKESPIVEMYEKEIEAATTKHSHYFKDCPYAKVDVYRILEIFDVTDPCIQHCVKKLLCAGGRGHKDINLDINNVIDTLQRWKDMREEEKNLEN